MIKVAQPNIDADDFQAFVESFNSGAWAAGEQVSAFEAEFASYIGTEFAVAVSSGTAALYLAMKAIGIGPGDFVAVPALTFYATAGAVVMTGAKPLFIDINPQTFCMSQLDLESKLSRRVQAIVPVHLYGERCDVEPMIKFGGDHIPVIEDCAQAIGTPTEASTRRVGSTGIAGCFSFMATKQMTTIEGGMVTTDSFTIAQAVRLMAHQGMRDRHTHVRHGFNFKMSEPHAALGRSQLAKLDPWNRLRRRNAMHVRTRVEGVDWLQLPPMSFAHTCFWNPVIIFPAWDVDDIVKQLSDAGVEVRYRYRVPLHRQPCFADTAQSQFAGCPVADNLAGRIIGLPCGPELTSDDLRHIVEAVESVKPKEKQC